MPLTQLQNNVPLPERMAFVEGEVSGMHQEVQRIAERVDHLEVTINLRFNQMEERITGMETKFEVRFKAIEDRITGMETKFEARFEAIDRRFESIENKFDTKFTALDNKIDQGINSLRNMTIMFGMFISLLITVFKFLL